MRDRLIAYVALAVALIVVWVGFAWADYVTTILADSPCSLWKMDETSGNIAQSIPAVSGWTGVAHGGLTYAQTGGVTGYTSILFNGSTGYFDISNGGGAEGNCMHFSSGAGTVECWIKSSDNAADVLMEQEGAGGKSFEFVKATKAVTLGIFNPTEVDAVGTTNTPLNTWYLAAGTYSSASSGTITANYNGTTETTVTSAGTPGGFTQATMGAHTSGSSNFLSGSMQMCAIYPTALSDATLTAHYNAGLAPLGLPNMGRRIFQSRRTIINPYFLPASFGVREPQPFKLNLPTFIIDKMNRRAITSRSIYAEAR